MEYNKHYIRTDAEGNIVYGFSDAFEQPLDGDICITEQGGRQFDLLGEINPSLRNDDGMYLYKYEGGVPVKKTPEEIKAVTDVINLEKLRESKLEENSVLCNQILENEFKSTVKGDGLQPYRMNDDDDKNLIGYNTMIIFALMEDPTGANLPLFEWKNKDQIKCVKDWHFTQIINLLKEFGAWKVLILKRQDDIKEKILKAKTEAGLNKIKIDYSDLLVFSEEPPNESEEFKL